MREYKDIAHQRMQQVLVHSCIYYDYNTNIVPDWQYDNWGNELIDIITKHPNVIQELPYGYMFSTYTTCCSGYDLPFRHPLIRSKAERLLKLRNMI